MALVPLYKYFVFNNELRPNSLFVASENEGGVYEVLRITDGVPLFLEDHFKRFYKSAEIAQNDIGFSAIQIERLLNELINKNKVSSGNILISYKTNLKAYFIQHSYPTEKMYLDGVVCGILKAERLNPNAKIFQTSVRDSANQMILENDFYEVILVDHSNHITEGSRTNIFFVRDGELFTPPGNEVLLGITRQKTIETAQQLKIPFAERKINLFDIKDYQAAFITGTSPKILSVKQLGDNDFDVNNEIVTRLMKGFDDLIRDYIGNKKY